MNRIKDRLVKCQNLFFALLLGCLCKAACYFILLWPADRLQTEIEARHWTLCLSSLFSFITSLLCNSFLIFFFLSKCLTWHVFLLKRYPPGRKSAVQTEVIFFRLRANSPYAKGGGETGSRNVGIPTGRKRWNWNAACTSFSLSVSTTWLKYNIQLLSL